MKSTTEYYGRAALSLHWSIATLIAVAIMTGFAADAAGASGQAPLRLHIAAGGLAGLLTLARIVWWWRFDTKPRSWSAGAERRAAAFVHGLLVWVPVLMLASGLGMMAAAGGPSQIFDGPLPNFEEFGPRRPHGFGARLLLVLASVHVAAALFHHFVRKDRLIARMWPAAREIRED